MLLYCTKYNSNSRIIVLSNSILPFTEFQSIFVKCHTEKHTEITNTVFEHKTQVFVYKFTFDFVSFTTSLLTSIYKESSMLDIIDLV